MQAEMYEIGPCPAGRLATMPRPRGGVWLRAELASLADRGVTDMVSLLTPPEDAELGLQAEERFSLELGMRFHRHPVADRSVPDRAALDRLVDALLPVMRAQGFVAIHCRAGIGRSSVVAAAVLIRLGLTPEQAIALISHARGFDIPDTYEQLEFIHSLGRGDPPAE